MRPGVALAEIHDSDVVTGCQGRPKSKAPMNPASETGRLCRDWNCRFSVKRKGVNREPFMERRTRYRKGTLENKNAIESKEICDE
jgi:hypothetical protein